MTQTATILSNTGGEIVVTGVGVVTTSGVGFDRHWQLLTEGGRLAATADNGLEGLQPGPHCSDRRMLKAVSKADAIGIVAIEGLRKDCRYTNGHYPAERVGLYVGAPPASAFDNEPYMDALLASRDGAGRCSTRVFGRTCMSSRPTTLLVGLPNNALCYGAMLLDARGPNSNYNSTAVSGHMAVLNAAKRLERGQLDLAVAGGFSMHSDPVNAAMYAQLGYARPSGAAGSAVGSGARLADGGVFVALETRAGAAARGQPTLATYVGGTLASDALGPMTCDAQGKALAAAVHRTLRRCNVAPAAVGLVLASAACDGSDDGELAALAQVFGGLDAAARPAVGTCAAVFGQLMEAGGVLELAVVSRLFARGAVSAAMRWPAAAAFPTAIVAERPYALILRTSPWGESSCLVVRKEPVS